MAPDASRTLPALGHGHARVDGPLKVSGAGEDFAGPTAEFPYVLSAMGTGVDVAGGSGGFSLRFATVTTTADLPVLGISLAGSLGGCEELAVDYLRMVVPESAKDLAFHGSTVGALMGATTVSGDAGVSGWVLELLGSTSKVSFTGGTP